MKVWNIGPAWKRIPSKPADVFLLSPTVDMGTAGNYNLSLEDAGMKGKVKGRHDHAAWYL